MTEDGMPIIAEGEYTLSIGGGQPGDGCSGRGAESFWSKDKSIWRNSGRGAEFGFEVGNEGSIEYA